MGESKKNGYVFIFVTVIISIILVILSIMINNQKTNLSLIKNYKVKDIVEQDLYAIELVLLDVLQNQINLTDDLAIFENYNNEYKTNEGNTIRVNLFLKDNCYNINSMVYKNSNGSFEAFEIEENRTKNILTKLNINPLLTNNFIDWLDTDNLTLAGEDERLIYIKNNFAWIPRNNLAVTNEEIFMIPGTQKYLNEINKHFCVNYFNSKFNLKSLSPFQISMYLPFLSEKQAEIIKSRIIKDIWVNSGSINKTNNNLKNLKKEIEQVLRRTLSKKEDKYLKNVSFKSKSILSEFEYITLQGEKWYSISKFEVDANHDVRLIYRFGPTFEDKDL